LKLVIYAIDWWGKDQGLIIMGISSNMAYYSFRILIFKKV